MDRSKSVLKSLVATTLLTAGLLAASAALAQRAISNSRSGNDTSTPRVGPELVGGDIFNTDAQIAGANFGGRADVFSVMSSVESAAAARLLAAGYGGSSTHTLSLAMDATPDRAVGNGISSKGLFKLSTGLGDRQGAAQLAFQRPQFGDFLFVFSGTYPNNTGLASERRDWSAYYLFDKVGVVTDDGADTVEGYMNFELFKSSSGILNPLTGITPLYKDYTTGLVVNQVSIYTLDRTLRPNAVPEAGSLALAGLGLAVLVAVRRRRRGART
jgi:PEP-CTERM motif